MNPKLFYVSMLMCLASTQGGLFAQDLIVTLENDSLNCKIKKITEKHISFVYKQDNDVKNTVIPASQVKSHIKDFYDVPELKKGDHKKEKYSDWHILARSGFSLQLGKTPNVPAAQQRYLKELKSGFHIAAEVAYFFTEVHGIGANYSVGRFKNKSSSLATSDNITIPYIALGYYSRKTTKNGKVHFMSNISLGYAGYNDKATYEGNPFTITGGAFGMVIGFNAGFELFENFTLNPNISLLSGNMGKYTLDDGQSSVTVKPDNDQRISLSRIDFSVGVMYRL